MLNIFAFEIYLLRRGVAAYELSIPPRPAAAPAMLTSNPKPKNRKTITPDESLDPEKIQTIIDTMRGETMTQPEIVLRVTFSKSTVRAYVEAMVRQGLLKECGRYGKSTVYFATDTRLNKGETDVSII